MKVSNRRVLLYNRIFHMRSKTLTLAEPSDLLSPYQSRSFFCNFLNFLRTYLGVDYMRILYFTYLCYLPVPTSRPTLYLTCFHTTLSFYLTCVLFIFFFDVHVLDVHAFYHLLSLAFSHT